MARIDLGAIPGRGMTLGIDVLDVGHGSCVVVRAGGCVVLVDSGPGGAILEYLLEQQIDRISAVLISHADADHIGGLIALLSQRFPVDRIIWNGDALKASSQWLDLVYLLNDLDAAGLTAAQQEAGSGLSLHLGPNVQIRILAPGLILRRLGAGATDRDARRILTNSVSVVAQVVVEEQSLMLLPGDLDDLGYEYLRESNASLRSRYLVLPHHGGWLGTPAATKMVTAELLEAVQPEAIFVSNGRGRFNNPRPEVVSVVRDLDSDVPIVCTQLSATCASKAVVRERRGGAYSVGWSQGHACAGSRTLVLENGLGTPFARPDHEQFLIDSVPHRLCMERSTATSEGT